MVKMEPVFYQQNIIIIWFDKSEEIVDRWRELQLSIKWPKMTIWPLGA